MFSKNLTFCITTSFGSAGAFILPNTNKPLASRLFYREHFDNESQCTQTQLPSGPFGILPSPTSVTEQDAARLEHTLPFTTFAAIEPEPLISASYPLQITSYCPNVDLPASATRKVDTNFAQFTEAIELSVGRMAMMSALFLFMDEIVTGQSLPQQLSLLIGEPM
ncbi:hypothetical protein ACHAWX_007320 [Stephanocyclus meneghinianus]